MINARIFIADAVCALPYGHNSQGVRAFTASLARYFETPIPLVCKNLPATVEMPPRTDRAFTFYYSDKINLPPDQRGFIPANLLKPKTRRILKRARAFSIAKLRLPLIKDPHRAKARRDWNQIFRRYGINHQDVIFFPCGDYYSVRGLIHTLDNEPFTQWPVIHIHLINVMENESGPAGGGAAALVKDLLASGVIGRRIFVSAEAPAYAAKLSNLLFTTVPSFAFPPTTELLPLEEKPTFNVAAIGSGRGDKGYFRLADIADHFHSTFPDSPVRFIIQSMSPEYPEYNPAYEKRLRNLGNATITEHRLSAAAMVALYQSSDLLLLPYCRQTYRFRGSAVMSEGYGYGRPIVATAGTAFETMIKRHGNGVACNSDADFCTAIHTLSERQPEQAQAAAISARSSYINEYETAMQRLSETIAAAVHEKHKVTPVAERIKG